MRKVRIAAAALILASMSSPLSAQTASQQAPARHDCSAAPYHALDFWIGEWEVFDAATHQHVGRSRVSGREEGCVVEEEWTGDGAHDSGRSLNVYDGFADRWFQYWVDTSGGVSRFEGGPAPDGSLRVADMHKRWPGRSDPVAIDITFTPEPDGSVRQHGRVSLDGGVTWQDRYDYLYRRRS